jgi:hypothetical protein
MGVLVQKMPKHMRLKDGIIVDDLLMPIGAVQIGGRQGMQTLGKSLRA